MLVMEDVTEQVRLSGQIQSIERQLANVVEHATDIILSTDSETRVTTWNRSAEILCGYSFGQVKGHPLSEYLADECRPEFERAIATVKRAGQPQMIYSDLVTAQGARLPMSWVCSPMRNDQGAIEGVVAVGRDMSGAKHFEAQLHQSQRLAALGVMAGGIAHELRNPLTLISSGAQFLLEDDVSPDFRKECAQQIKSGTERASLVIENLLRFARPQTGEEAYLGKVEIAAVVKAALEFVDNLAKLQRVRVVTDHLSHRFLVPGNETLLQHVFINLFPNAIDAMPEGGSLAVSAGRDGGQVFDLGQRYRMRDSGRGGQPNLRSFLHALALQKGHGLGSVDLLRDRPAASRCNRRQQRRRSRQQLRREAATFGMRWSGRRTSRRGDVETQLSGYRG
jgi:PAS domain S-box-containing protein